MPQQVCLAGDRKILNTYATDGRKLKTTVKEGEELMDGTKYYNANFVFDKQKEMEYILFDEGRIVNYGGNLEYEYHIKDHLGSVRVAFVPTTSGTEIVQENAYYPFGGTIGDFSYNASENRYGYNGKEQIKDFDLNLVDFGQRLLNPQIIQLPTPDRFAEKYYHISPYAFAAGNPIRYIDFNGDSLNFSYAAGYDERNGTSYVQKIQNDAEAHTGLTLSFNQDKIGYDKDENGNPIIATTTNSEGEVVLVGSATANKTYRCR